MRLPGAMLRGVRLPGAMLRGVRLPGALLPAALLPGARPTALRALHMSRFRPDEASADASSGRKRLM